jgi:hypothetical protein
MCKPTIKQVDEVEQQEQKERIMRKKRRRTSHCLNIQILLLLLLLLVKGRKRKVKTKNKQTKKYFDEWFGFVERGGLSRMNASPVSSASASTSQIFLLRLLARRLFVFVGLNEDIQRELRLLGGGSCLIKLNQTMENLRTFFFHDMVSSEKVLKKSAGVERIVDELVDWGWEQLHCGEWSKVSVVWREFYSASCFLKALCELWFSLSPKQAMKTLDLALLMGGPSLTSNIQEAINEIDSYINIQEESKGKDKLTSSPSFSLSPVISTSKRKRGEEQQSKPHVRLKEASSNSSPSRPSSSSSSSFSSRFPPQDIPIERQIPRIETPSLERFLRDYMKPRAPVILTRSIDDWRAIAGTVEDPTQRWSNLEYLKSVAGRRTVPIEVGRDYLHPDWSQKLITFNDFVDQFVCNKKEEEKEKEKKGGKKEQTKAEPEEERRKGYLAQTELFEQIPDLKQDYQIPEYCFLVDRRNYELVHHRCDKMERGEGEEEGEEEEGKLVVNAWFGPSDTISPCHYDKYHNLLAQVVGRKYIRLYSPSWSSSLYPHTDSSSEGGGGNSKMLFNTSQVDVGNPDFKRFPLFSGAPFVECILEPGELLYIPPFFWHYVTSLSISFSISFWWW